MSFTLYYGCMFAGKTSALLRDISSYKANKHNILVLKPFVDTRYNKDFVVSHDQVKFPGSRIRNSVDILKLVTPDTKLIAIDELQFFDTQIVEVISSLKSVYMIVGSGLDKDYLKNPFGSMPQLIEIADNAIELFAKCTLCEAPASLTHRHSESKELILPGDNAVYQARCNECWE